MRVYFTAYVFALTLIFSVPSQAADMTAEQSALLYDLLEPYAGRDRPPKNVDPEIFNRAIESLKAEKLIGSGRPNYKDKGLLQKYGKALFLGARTKEFAKEIGQIHDLVNKSNQEELKKALSDLWWKAGRDRPSEKALKPVLDSLYGAKGAAPQETINHIYKKPDYRVEVVHAKAGGRMQVNVVELDKKGKEVARTVISGVTETAPNERGDELQRKIKPEKACTNTPKTDKDSFKKIKGEWRSNTGAVWKISGTKEDLILIDTSNDSFQTEYKGAYNLGKIYAEHAITNVNAIGEELPLEVRSQLINKGHTFRVHLETCNEKKKKLRGTWSSQHVTYDAMFMAVKRVHDPYDLTLILSQGKKSKDNIMEGAADNEIP